MLIILFRVYNTAIACYNVLALEGQHPRTAADDEPTSRADKARGVSCRVQSSEYTPLYNRRFKKSSAVKRTIGTACYLLKGKKAESGTHNY